jgi:hypothetical protein
VDAYIQSIESRNQELSLRVQHLRHAVQGAGDYDLTKLLSVGELHLVAGSGSRTMAASLVIRKLLDPAHLSNVGLSYSTNGDIEHRGHLKIFLVAEDVTTLKLWAAK